VHYGSAGKGTGVGEGIVIGDGAKAAECKSTAVVEDTRVVDFEDVGECTSVCVDDGATRDGGKVTRVVDGGEIAVGDCTGVVDGTKIINSNCRTINCKGNTRINSPNLTVGNGLVCSYCGI